MLEPRGHADMFGSIITEPCNKEADFGIIFMDGGGYLEHVRSRFHHADSSCRTVRAEM